MQNQNPMMHAQLYQTAQPLFKNLTRGPTDSPDMTYDIKFMFSMNARGYIPTLILLNH
jgi:hypothetical protein